MKIDQIDLYEVRMRLKTKFQASTHEADDLRHILIRIRSGDVVGWGECSAPNDPFYLGETADSSWHMLESFLVPSVLGKDFADVAAFAAAYDHVKGNTFARAGIEIAAWDLFGRARGESVASMLGGTRKEISSGVSLGMEEFEALCDRIARHVDEGYRRVKLKISPKYDAELFEKLRPRFPKVPFMADANSTYTLADVERLRRLDQYDLMMIEQPLAWDDFVDHAKLQKEIKTPVCLDESVKSEVQARNALELGSCRVLNVKAGRVGGLLEAKRVHDLCLAQGILVWCGGMHDYGVGRAANVALASLPGFTLPGDVSGSDKYFEEDLVEPPILAKKGAIQVPDRPGLGFDVVEERVTSRTTRTRRFT